MNSIKKTAYMFGYKPIINISIILPGLIQPITMTKKQLVDLLTDKTHGIYSIKEVLCGGMSKKDISAAVHDALDTKPDLIVSFGEMPTRITAEACQQLPKKIDHLACCITEDVFDDMKALYPNFLAVVTQYARYQNQLDVIIKITSREKRIAVLFNDAMDGLHKLFKGMNRYAHLVHKLELKKIPVKDMTKLAETINRELGDTTTLMTLRDPEVLCNIETVSTVCKKKNVTLYTTDVFSVGQGADISFGLVMDDVGVMCAELAFKMLFFPDQSGIKSLLNNDQYVLRINQASMKNDTHGIMFEEIIKLPYPHMIG